MQCICSGNLMYPELGHNCGCIYSYICVWKHVCVSMHSGSLLQFFFGNFIWCRHVYIFLKLINEWHSVPSFSVHLLCANVWHLFLHWWVISSLCIKYLCFLSIISFPPGLTDVTVWCFVYLPWVWAQHLWASDALPSRKEFPRLAWMVGALHQETSQYTSVSP